MKITPRLTLLFLGLSLTPMGLLSLEYYRTGKAALREEVLGHLATTARHLEVHLSREHMALKDTARMEGFLRVEGAQLADSKSLILLDRQGGLMPVHEDEGSPRARMVAEALKREGRLDPLAPRDALVPDLVTEGGSHMLAALRPLEALDGWLVVAVEQDRAFEPVTRFRDRTVLALFLASFAALLCSLAVSRRITRPVLDLVDLARDFSVGKLSRRARPRGRDELAELAASLNAMAECLSQEMQAYIDRMSTLSAKLDGDGKVMIANRAALAAAGESLEMMRGRHFLDAPMFREDPALAARFRAAFEEAREGRTVHREDSFLAKRGRIYFAYSLSPVRHESGSLAYVIAEGRDISALKDAESALHEVNEGLEDSIRERTANLREAVRQKDILLKEIHHRVKNNLQIISSLLTLQSGHVKDPQVAGILLESRNRVKSMALVHERLYAGEDLGRTGFTDYIRDLIAQLVRSSETYGRGVQLDFDMEDIPLGLTKAVPCGLAIHELVANSLKHAFPEGRAAGGDHGRVVIRSRVLPEEGFEVEVEDNGVGLPEGFDPRRTRSLGLQLVFTLVRQLRGVVQVDRGLGTRVRIAVPGHEEKGA